jgi:RNA polymerase sigma-70 factor, ECF subfamily
MPDTVDAGRAEVRSDTLGDVLYAKGQPLVPEREWLELVRAIAAGHQAALHALYQRSHRMVFTLAVRITCSRESAEEVTLDVFHDVWRRAGTYDPANGTVLGWIMNQARSRAIDRVRFEQRKKRVDPRLEADEPGLAADPCDALELLQRCAAVRTAFGVLSADERRAIDSAFFAELTHAEIAERLQEPLGTVKTRIRSGLRKLREALEAQKEAQ